MNKYKADELADNSDNEKCISKAEETELAKKRKAVTQKSKGGSKWTARPRDKWWSPAYLNPQKRAWG